MATARAGNVIGGGDWASDRLVPDCVRAFVKDEPVSLRFPQAVRPWQHVLEPLAGYLQSGRATLCDPAVSTLRRHGISDLTPAAMRQCWRDVAENLASVVG